MIEDAPKTLLIVQAGTPLVEEGLARWLASFSDLTGMILLRERRWLRWRRLWRERQRVGLWRLLDILAYRVYAGLVLAQMDARWQRQALQALCRRFPALRPDLPRFYIHSPNTPKAVEFIRQHRPDLMLAHCKLLLKPEVFSLPPQGTFVLHNGVTPEYRNAHGSFWALAHNDLDHVGMTLLRIDEGIDTGAVYGRYTYAVDEVRESPLMIQYRMILENLDRLQQQLLDIAAGKATALDTAGRTSAMWGQPWLTAYVRWKCHATRRRQARC